MKKIILSVSVLLVLLLACEAPTAPAETAPSRYDVRDVWISEDFQHVGSADIHTARLTLYSDGSFEILLLDNPTDMTPKPDLSARGSITDGTNPASILSNEWFSVTLTDAYSGGSWVSGLNEDNNIMFKNLTSSSFEFRQDNNFDGDSADNTGDANGTFRKINPLDGTWIPNGEGSSGDSGIIFSKIPGSSRLYAISASGPFYIADNDENNLEVLDISYTRTGDLTYKLTAQVVNGGWDTLGDTITEYIIVENNKLYTSDSADITTATAVFVYDRAPNETTELHGAWLGNDSGSDSSGLLFVNMGDTSPYTVYAVALENSQFNTGGIDGDDEHNLETLSYTHTDDGSIYTVSATVTNGGWDSLNDNISYYLLREDDRLHMSPNAGLTVGNSLFVYDRF